MQLSYPINPKSLRFSPLRLLICLESDVNGLSFWVFARDRITLLNSSILLQQRLHIAKVCVLRNPADDDLRRLTMKNRSEKPKRRHISERVS